MERDRELKGNFETVSDEKFSLGLKLDLSRRILTHSSRRISDDHVTKKIILFTGLSAYTDNPMNCFVNGKTSIEKAYTVTNILNYFPGEDVWFLGNLSPKALIHSHGVLINEDGSEMDEDYVEHRIEQLLDEAQKLVEAGKRPSKSVRRDAGRKAKRERREKLKKSKYLIKLSNKILVFLKNPHVETWMMLSPLLSHDMSETEYRFVDKTLTDLRFRTVILRGWPAMICCVTDQKHVKDLATRSFSVKPERTPEQFKAENLVTGKIKSRPWQLKVSEDPAFCEIKEYIECLKQTLKVNQWKIIVPYGEELAKIFPAKIGRDIINFNHLTKLIEIETAQHLFLRTRIKIGNEVYVLSNIQDLTQALKLLKDLEDVAEKDLPSHILNFFLHTFNLHIKKDQTFLIKELMEKYNETAEREISEDTVYKYITHLALKGYVTKEKNPDPTGNNRLKVIKRLYTPKTDGYYWITQSSPFFSEENLKKWFKDLQINWFGEEGKIKLFSLNDEKESFTTKQIPLKTFTEEPSFIKQLYLQEFQLTNPNPL